jgi:hypothetical protein
MGKDFLGRAASQHSEELLITPKFFHRLSPPGPRMQLSTNLRPFLLSFQTLALIWITLHVTELWTEAPQSDDEDATALYLAREAFDEEVADESEPKVPITLRDAIAAGQAVKIVCRRIRGVSACARIFL